MRIVDPPVAGAQRARSHRGCGLRSSGAVLVLWVAALAGCSPFAKPSNLRNWSPDQAVLPYAEMSGDVVRVHNVRNCNYVDAESYVLGYYDRDYDLERLTSVDFIVVPFRDLPSVAHTMLSFGFDDGNYLCLSVEIRREQGESYKALNGVLNAYEIMYVLGDERDLVQLRTNFRNDDVYVYRLRTTPEESRAIFLDALERANALAAQPEFYNTLTNNCTTSVLGHINHATGNRVPYGMSVLLPGYSDRALYDAGLIDRGGPFEEARRAAWVSGAAREVAGREDFSLAIRR